MLFTVFRYPKKEANSYKGRKERKKKKGTKPEKDQDEQFGQKKKRDLPGENPEETPPENETVQTADGQEDVVEASDKDTENMGQEAKEPLSVKIRRIVDKIKQIAIKVKEIFENIQYTIRKFCDKIKSTLNNIEYYQKVIEGEPFKRSWQLCRKEISSVLKGLKPDKLEVDLVIGMEDPASLGEILAVWGMMYPFIGQHIRIAGDFECGRTRVEGSIYVQGKVRAFAFLKAAVRIYFNKDVKTLIKLLKKEAA